MEELTMEKLQIMVMEDKIDELTQTSLETVMLPYSCATCPVRQTCDVEERKAEYKKAGVERHWDVFDCAGILLQRIRERAVVGDL